MTHKLIWRCGQHEEVIITGNKALCEWRKLQAKDEAQWQGGRLEVVPVGDAVSLANAVVTSAMKRVSN